jgi:hypothetical protein
VGNPTWQPSPPDWWNFPPNIGPCSCDCVDFVNPQNPAAGCNLTCVTCAGLQCNANVEVTAGSCSYQFNLTPSTSCCGTPALVDTVFAIDYSGSMEGEIDDVIANVGQIADELSVTGGQARFGLIVYGKAENDVTINTFSNGEILTEDIDDFKAKMQDNLPVTGGSEPDFDAAEAALQTYPWGGVENLLFIIGDELVDNGRNYPISGDFGNPTGQPSAAMLIELANTLSVIVNIVQPQPGSDTGDYDSRKADLALGTNGKDLDIAADFSDVIDELNLNVFGASCDCLDFTPIPVELCTGGTGLGGDECINPDPMVPIRKCVEEDNSDCLCNEPLAFNVCGEIVIVEPDTDTLNLVCCGEIQGGGCACPTDPICPEGCCGVVCSGIDVCADFTNVQNAIDTIWCECWRKAIEGEHILETPGCTQCTIPDPTDPNFDVLDIDAITNCSIKICDGQGGFFTITRPEIVAEVEAAWANCVGPSEPPPLPPVSEASCLPECDRQDECIIGSLSCSDTEDVRDCRKSACSNPGEGCISVRNPSTVVLNNGIGLVAYESMTDNSVIKIDQFNTSIPAKILPNRRTDYGRIQNELNWEDGSSTTKLPKLYYFNDIASHFINGHLGIPQPNSLTDTLVFRTGPLQNQCFSLHETPLGEDSIGNFIQFTISTDYTLSNPFPSLDDVYDVEWFIIDSDDTGLTGSVVGQSSTTPGFDFLLDTSAVNSALQLTPHIHDGKPSPVANPSLAVACNYMNAMENSHFVYLVYQALEDSKWNLYMRQLRLSEYSREEQIDQATFAALSQIGIDELVYRVVCITDDCSSFGNDFLATRTVTFEAVLPDGRDVFNEPLLTSTESWTICAGFPAGSFPKKRVYAELTHSAIVNKCPDQFQFNDLFYNWEAGDEFSVPFTDLTANLLFTLVRKPNDSSIEISEDTQRISGIIVSSSQVGAVWFDDPTISTWVAPDTETFQELLQFKGLDVSEPMPITDFETGHCTHPVVKVNSNNEVFVVYECTDPLIHQIHITGTATPSTSLPLGVFIPKNIDANLDYFLSPNDFIYRTNVTMSGEGINQLPDMHIDANDVIHLGWQSNRDDYWEVYYAKSDDSFRATRITDSKSKSLKPSITGDIRGNLHIAWHDNRFGNWEILMAYRDDERVEGLFEQDPYLAGLRNEGYSHSTDVIPLVLINNSFTDPMCISNLTVRFFSDRFLTQGVFDVLQSEFPIAFQVPSMRDDRTTISWEYTDISWPPAVFVTLNETEYDRFGPDLERSMDSELTGSHFDTIQLGFAVQPQFIRFLASPYPDEIAELAALKQQAVAQGMNPDDLTTDNTQWITDLNTHDTWIKADHLVSGETYDVEELARDFFSIQPFVLPTGRYKRVEVLLTLETTFDFSLVQVVSVLKNRVCLAPQETITAFLDLTPSIRMDKNGNEIIETPIPVAARKNAVYFIAVLAIQDNGQIIAFDDQKRSVSCETCIDDASPWDSASCTFKVVFSNFNAAQTRFYNARIRFYADQTKTDLLAQFEAFSDGTQLNCFTTDDNRPAQDVWQTAGYEVPFGQQRTITLWPLLSNTTGLLCGIQYWVETEICDGTEQSPCIRTGLVSTDLVSWVCDCASPRWSERFGDPPVNIRDLVRWRSSGDGFSDTRLTETGSVNNYNPQILIRSDLTGIVLYESDRNDPNRIESQEEIHTIYATAFSIFPSSSMYASGAEIITGFGELLVHSDIPITACGGSACDDCSDNEATCNAMQGRNISFALDQYDNLFLAAERQRDQTVCEEFVKNSQQSIIVHRCGARAKNLNFIPEEQEGAGVFPCDASAILGQTAPLSADRTFKKIIKMARVQNKFTRYHITRTKRPAAVVDQCVIGIEIVAEPDAIAVRLRNENESWSQWFPFDPEIGEYTTVIPWTLSPISGLKTVTIEAATYQGLSTTAVITIVADYKGVDHTIKFYRLNTPNAATPGRTLDISNSELLSLLSSQQEVFAEENELLQLEGLPVAGIRRPSIEGEGDDAEIVKETGEFIFIEVFPSQEYIESLNLSSPPTADQQKLFPTFDVLQQGDDDQFSLPTTFDETNQLFQGVFPIKKDNKTFFKDGLSFVIMHFTSDCSDISVETAATGEYTRDKFNLPIPSGTPVPGATAGTEDVWASERDEKGLVKHRFDIRGTEDPYFVFGDPNYRLKKPDE